MPMRMYVRYLASSIALRMHTLSDSAVRPHPGRSSYVRICVWRGTSRGKLYTTASHFDIESGAVVGAGRSESLFTAIAPRSAAAIVSAALEESRALGWRDCFLWGGPG